MRRIRRRRIRRTLAVSTVIANMMMITITLGLAAILIAWTGSTYGLFAGGTQIFYQERGQAMQERFVVENVFSNTGGFPIQMQVFVRNAGVEQINVVAIYVSCVSCVPPTETCVSSTGLYGTNQENCSGSSDPYCNSLTDCIPVGSVGEYILNLPSTLGSLKTGSILYIVVASARGNRATYTVRLYVPGT